MIVRLALVAWLALCGVANAQMAGGLQFPGPGTAHSAGGAYVGPGDVVSGAKAWYGLRAYSSATRGTKAVNVCNSTGGVSGVCADMFTDATTGALVPQVIGGITCPGTTDCTIAIWYDQTAGGNCGGSCDLFPPSPTAWFNRAQLISNCIGSLPCGRSDNSGFVGIYATAGNFTLAQPYSVPMAARLPTAAGGIVLDDSSFNVQPLAFVSGSSSVRVSAGSDQDTSVSFNTTHALLSISNNAATSILVVDGTNNSLPSIGANSFGSAGAAPLAMGDKVPVTADYFEFGIWGIAFTTTAVTGQAVLMCHNQFAYWGTATSC